MLGTVPAELVWRVADETAAYDTLLYRAMTAELWLCFALCGADSRTGLWYCQYFRDRHEVWSLVAQRLVGQDGMA